MWTDDVVLIIMKVVAFDVQLAHLLLRYLLAGWVLSLIERGADDETRAGCILTEVDFFGGCILTEVDFSETRRWLVVRNWAGFRTSRTNWYWLRRFAHVPVAET